MFNDFGSHSLITFLEPDGCPQGYTSRGFNNPRCPGTGQCCTTGYRDDCGQSCAKQLCEGKVGGKWIPLDYNSNPFTCEIGNTADFKCKSIVATWFTMI